MSVEWSDEAYDDLLRLNASDAVAVDRAVQLWDASGQVGKDDYVHAAGPSAYLLYTSGYVVLFYFDAGVMHVAQVRRP